VVQDGHWRDLSLPTPDERTDDMTRALAARLLSLCLFTAGVGTLVGACTKTDDSTGIDVATGSGGSGAGRGGAPAATGGKSGAGAGGSSGGSTGSGGDTSTGSGGAAAGGGSGGSSTGTPDASDDAPVSTGSGGSAGDTAAPADGPVTPGSDAGDPGGDILPGRPYIHLCKKEWSQAQCCEFLCSCLQTNCTDSPMDKPRIPMCMSMCMKLTDFRARCQVFHCYESKSPTAVMDHASHCGHASGRVGGGSCTAIMP
jgi:hypothetical protein